MKTCHQAHNSSVECSVATTVLRCTAWLQSIEMILIVSCVQILSLTSMRFRLIQNNLFPVSSLSGQSSSRIHWDPPCPLHSGRVQPPSQSPFSWMNQEHNEAWWVWFIFILWIIIPITLSQPAINGASEGRRRQTVQFDCSHLCPSWSYFLQQSMIKSSDNHHSHWLSASEEDTELETLRKWWLGQEEKSSEQQRDNDWGVLRDRKVKVRKLAHCLCCSQ